MSLQRSPSFQDLIVEEDKQNAFSVSPGLSQRDNEKSVYQELLKYESQSKDDDQGFTFREDHGDISLIENEDRNQKHDKNSNSIIDIEASDKEVKTEEYLPKLTNKD